MITKTRFSAICLAALGMATFGTASLAQDVDPYPAAIIFQSGYGYGWLAAQEKAEHFADFAEQPFYGAFVANEDGDSYWYSGFHNMETVRTAALAWCEIDRSAGSDPCELIAYLAPQYVDDNFVSGLSNTAIVEYTEYLEYGTSRAFAVSPNGAYAYAWDHVNQQDADEAALEICNDSAQGKSEWELGQSHACVIFQDPNTFIPATKPKPAPRIKK